MRKLENTRDTIVFAAVNCFAEKGFYGTTIREIGAACNVTDPTIYHYFQNKEDLYRETLNYVHHVFFLILEDVLIQGRDLRSELTSYFLAITEWGKGVRPGSKAYIESSFAHVFDFFHTIPSSMREDFMKRFHKKLVRLITGTMAHHRLKGNLLSLVAFFSTLFYGFAEKIAAVTPGPSTYKEISDAVEQTMQFVSRIQENDDQSAQNIESGPMLQPEEMQQLVQKRMQGYPHKIFSFKDIRAYIRYGHPT